MRLGNQEPTFERIGGYASSRGADAVAMFGEYGVSFMPAQERELELFLAVDGNGDIAAKTICISKPRQNGKSFAVRFYAIWQAVVEGMAVLFSAHNGSTTRKMFRFIVDFIENHDDFRVELKPGNQGIYRAQGHEGIYFRNGGCIEFSTRTNSGARGGTYAIIVVDEAQELTDEQLEALKPTQMAAGGMDKDDDPQTIYLGTPPNPKSPGTVFYRFHEQAHQGDTSVWWQEWAVEKIPDDPKDPDVWYRTNPAMGYMIKESTMLDAVDTLSPEGAARELFGWWSKTGAYETVIDADAWAACFTEHPIQDGVICYAVKFSPDGSLGTIAAAIKDESVTHVEVVDSVDMAAGLGFFTSWLVKRRDKAAQIVVDGQSNAQALIDALLAEGVRRNLIIKPRTSDFIAATSTFLDAVKSRRVTHYIDTALDASATKCAKRNIGKDGGFGFSSTDEAEASLIEACCLAYWAAATTKRQPGRKTGVAF